MNILTFDIEDWFHILDNDSTKFESNWSHFESRIEVGLNIILNFLDQNNISAHFFVLGWIAEKYPKLIAKINNRGFSIGSHTHYHQLLYSLSKKNLKNDIEKSIKTIEDCIGKKVTSFRAPGFSITNSNKWAFEILYQQGIRLDSSIFPTLRAHGGYPGINIDRPCLIEQNNLVIKEFPINTKRLMGYPVVFSGGGYFRIYPYNLIKNWTKNSDYIMTYFHPRDFDNDQPVLKDLSYYRRFKSYVGIKGCKKKLQRWVNDFDFIDLEKASSKIMWSEVQKFVL